WACRARRCTGGWTGSASNAPELRHIGGTEHMNIASHWSQRIPLRVAFTLTCLGWIVAVAALTAWWSAWLPQWQAAVAAVTVLAVPMALQVRRLFVPMNALFRALAGTVASYRDGDYAFGLSWRGSGELGELVAAHNRLGDALREQRVALVQRELLLDTMVQNTPVGMLLVDAAGRIVLGNLAARKLLGGGRRLEATSSAALLEAAPAPMPEAFARGGDGMFTTGDADEEGIYRPARRRCRLKGGPDELALLRQLRAELRGKEVQTWKKVIRV